MHTVPVGIVGASGYSGVEATRILAQHPGVELRLVTSDRWAGERVSDRFGFEGPVGALTYAPQADVVEQVEGLQVVLLATPASVSLALAPKLLERGLRIIDLSGAFRLRDLSQYPAFYGFTHDAPGLLQEAVYGLPEFNAEAIRGARLVANPGCYATAAALALAPLLRGALLAPGALIVNAASGTTGAGRSAAETLSFSEVDEDFRAYRTLRHQHTPEIVQTLGDVAGQAPALTFTPHLLPLKRGILITAYAQLREGAEEAELSRAFEAAYAQAPFTRLLSGGADAVGLKAVVGTNRCHLGVSVAGEDALDPRRIVVTGAIDNLTKGAAGQAIQNLNLMCGFDETLGLSTLQGFLP
ncbi:MAG TPA: N-acetyl-gamma-glutamyl-phosphate reductase [Myxococcaceae bacterium]|nr:N-acetyl-gamma-glutamyl-phosphate reductase [Myxococcaceae bacterium]